MKSSVGEHARVHRPTTYQGLFSITDMASTKPPSSTPPAPGSAPGNAPVIAATVAEQAQDTVDYSKSTVLVVDDNAQNVELLQAYLEAIGCTTIAASDGIAAIKYIEQSVRHAGEHANGDAQPAPDLILLDVMMPKMSGFEVCRKLKEDPATRGIPIMMVTALNELGDIERAVECGTDDFLTKPVNKLELVTRVKSLLRVRHLKRELDRTVAYIADLQARGIGVGESVGADTTHGGIDTGNTQPPPPHGVRPPPLDDDDADPGDGPVA